MTPCTVAHHASLFMGFPRQEYWSGFPFPSLGDLPNPGMEPTSATLAGRFFTTKPPGKPGYSLSTRKIISDGKRMVKDVKIKKVKIMWIDSNL